jgi:flagellar hook assembly protein FlgD
VTIGTLTLSIDHDHTWWVPSPFADRSNLVYLLTDDSARTRLRVFTASGRKILDDETLPTERGERHFLWDGRDEDGDPVANGIYFYELTVWDAQGKRADRVIDKVVRAR